MGAFRAGVSPADAQSTLAWTLRALEKHGAFDTTLDHALDHLARELMPALPSNYLPDVYLMQPLMGDVYPRAGFALDARERNYLHYQTDGAYFSASGISASTSPEDHAVVCGVVADGQESRPFCTRCVPVWDGPSQNGEHEDFSTRMESGAVDDAIVSLLSMIRPLPLKALVCGEGSRKKLVISLPRSPQEHFCDSPYRDTLLQALATAGVDPDRLTSLERVELHGSVPCYSDAFGFLSWDVVTEISHVSFTLDEGRVVGCAAGIRLTERTKPHGHTAYRPTRIYQWHITDTCDQRCKHCYLFAEDAQKACVTTPFDQLMRTLDEVEQRCAHRHMLPSFVITGGDPILHPRFWDFAEELHRRGFFWAIMGNPFHLTHEVCRRLHDLGCVRYQLSLDGLRDFHDSLRKPGSFDATMAAIPVLKSAGIPVQLMATASRQNLDDILACMDIAVEKGADFFSFARYCATSPEKAASLYPSPEEYRSFLLAFYEKRRRFAEAGVRCTFRLKEHLFCLLRYELGEFEVPTWSKEHPDVICDGCHLGQRAIITSNGDLLACRRMESHVGNLAHDRLEEVEEGDGMRTLRKVDAIKGCSSCKLLMWCRGCRAVGFNVTGDLQAADPMCWHVVRDE